jgi:hypothetical protein
MVTVKMAQYSMMAFAAAVMMAGAIAPAFAQSSGEASATTDIQTAYKSSYPEASADSDSSFNVQSQYHVYKPGDTVRVEGFMSEEMKEETEAESVTVKVADAQGEVVATQEAQVESDGSYSAEIALPADAEEGEYAVDSKIEVDATLLGLLSAEVVAKLESSSQFVIGSSSSFEVESEEGETFEVEITSNSNVGSVEFKQQEKKVSFTVEGETGTQGAAEVTIPKAMLSGEMTVYIDGELVAAESNDVILKSETETDVTFEINYHHSEHTVDVAGTHASPEFPVSALVMAVAVGSIVAAVSVSKRRGLF